LGNELICRLVAFNILCIDESYNNSLLGPPASNIF
jgi:hypothetical protein